MRDYKKYSIWNDSHKLTLEIYLLTKKFQKKNCLESQVK